jgi:hypothetical protein
VTGIGSYTKGAELPNSRPLNLLSMPNGVDASPVVFAELVNLFLRSEEAAALPTSVELLYDSIGDDELTWCHVIGRLEAVLARRTAAAAMYETAAERQ